MSTHNPGSSALTLSKQRGACDDLLWMTFHSILFASDYSPEFIAVAREQIALFLSGSINLAKGRERLKGALGVLGRPTDDDDLLNIYGEARLDVILKLNTLFAQEFRRWNEDQDELALDMWPACELVCMGEEGDVRAVRRRWREATGRARVSQMIALRCDAVWEKVSLLGTPYGPFDLNGLVSVEPVDRGQAESLRLLRGNEAVRPQLRVWEDDLAMAARAVDKLLNEMAQAGAVQIS